MGARLWWLWWLWFLATPTWATDFVMGNWGDSFDTILQQETRTNLTPKQTRDYLIYQDTIMGMQDARVVYFFSSDQLFKGALIFYQQASSTQTYLDRYQRVSDQLASRYGQPSQDDWLYKSEQMMDDPAKALESDQLTLQSVWQTDRLKIEHQLTFDHGMMSHQVVYHSKVDVGFSF